MENALASLQHNISLTKRIAKMVYISKIGKLCYFKDHYIIFGLIIIDDEIMYLVEDNSNSA